VLSRAVDHIIPPSEGVPAPNAPCNSVNEGFPSKFDFRRLGGRTTSLLMGGKVPRAVFQEPKKGPYNTSQFDLASVASTVHRLFNLSTQLTERTMWSAPFDELLLEEARTDTPMHLPKAPAPAEPWVPPPGDQSEPGWSSDPSEDDNDDDDDDRRRLASGGAPKPQHCGTVEQTCRGPNILSKKQQGLIEHYAALTSTDVPEGMAEMQPEQADRWLAEHWELWKQQGHPLV
jgi:hypothetical protein